MTDALKQLSDAMANAVEALSPSVVRVAARRRLAATGVVWSADGVIVTAHHVVERDDNIQVGLADGETLEATLVGRDPYNDLAVLRVSGASLVPPQWADTVKVGHLALALGRPTEQVQATLGVISAIVRKSDSRKRGWRGGMGRALSDGYIQTDVVMYPGFSGGPLMSAYGTVYGLNTSGFSRGVSLTIPVSTVKNSVQTLLEYGKVRQGYLGVGVQSAKLPESVAKEIGRQTGVLVTSIEADSPAEKGALYVGDIIVALDDEPIEDMEALLMALHGGRVGQRVALSIVRGGQLQTIEVVVGERN